MKLVRKKVFIFVAVVISCPFSFFRDHKYFMIFILGFKTGDAPCSIQCVLGDGIKSFLDIPF